MRIPRRLLVLPWVHSRSSVRVKTMDSSGSSIRTFARQSSALEQPEDPAPRSLVATASPMILSVLTFF